MPRDCGQCAKLAAAGQWDSRRQCQPVCYWRQFTTFEHKIYGLWTLCMAGERTKDASNRTVVRFWVDDGMVRECREGGHPAFKLDGWEPWEILACLKDIANFMSTDPNCQRRAVRGG